MLISLALGWAVARLVGTRETARSILSSQRRSARHVLAVAHSTTTRTNRRNLFTGPPKKSGGQRCDAMLATECACLADPC